MTEYFMKFMHLITMPRDDEKGATAVEYGLMVALIAGVIIAVVGLLGTDVLNAFDGVEDIIGGDQG